MTNIKEYFDNLYINAVEDDEKWNDVSEYETAVYEMDDEDFFKWAKENNIDLEAKASDEEETYLTYWCWDMAEADEY